MSEKQSTCFDASHLSRFLHEQLNESDESTVIEHLDECPDCQATLESVAADGVLWSDLQNQLSDSTQPGFAGKLNHQARVSSHRDQIVESVMEFLGPTDDPNMMGRLGSYEVSGVVGRGSTGIVLKAFETRLNRFVAIKVLAPNFASNGSARARFEREAKAVAAVAHEHVVPIFAVNEFKNLPYLVMQYAGGGSLQQRIDGNGPLDACEVARIGMQVASGLAAAHAQGIVHRDVKPANVMLEGGVERAMVTDFGLARVVDEASMTRSGAITGTPQFMSPEQARGEYIDHRSDLFSLGSLMYTATTGRPPFRSETVYGVIRRVCETDIRPVREINPTIPEWLEAFIAKLCSKNREDRFQSAEEVRDILARELAHLQSPQTLTLERSWLPNPITKKSPDTNKPRRQLAIFGTIAMILCTGVLLIPSVQNAIGKSWNFATASNDTESNTQPPPASFVWNADQLPVFKSTVTRALPVDTGGRVKLLVGNADVQILPSHSQQLEVRVVRKVAAVDRQRATTCFPQHRLQFTPDASGWIVESKIDADKMVHRFGQFSIRIYVPDGYGVDIPTPNDDVSTSVIGGELKAIGDGAVAFAYSDKGHWKKPAGKNNYQAPTKERQGMVASALASSVLLNYKKYFDAARVRYRHSVRVTVVRTFNTKPQDNTSQEKPMTLRITLLTFFALTFGLMHSAHAHNGHIASAEPVSNITIDGDLSDWPSEMKTQFISTTLFLCDGMPNREGFRGRYRVGCNYEQNALYIAVEIEDDSIVLDGIGDEDWNSRDGCEIFLSLDHAGEETAPVQFVYRANPTSIVNNELNEELAKHAKAARASDDTQLTYEWRIDLEALGEGKCNLAKGAVIGFDVAYLDRDTADVYAFYSSSPGVHKHLHSHQMGDLVVPAENGTKLVQLAGRAAWANATQHPLKSLRLQSLASEATFFQLPLTANGQFMLTLPAGEYALSAIGDQPDTSTKSQELSIAKDTLLTELVSFEVATETESPANVTPGSVVHFDLAHGQRPLSQLEPLGEKLGYTLRATEQPISSEALDGANLLYLLGPTTRFADEEKAAVIDFVRHGGSLLLVVDESRRSSLSETQANDLIAPFELKLTGDTEYVHNCGAIAKSGPIQKPCEVPFSGGRAVEGGSPFGFQLDRDGNPSHPFATAKKVTGGGRIIVLSEAMAAIFLGTPDGERLSGTPRNFAETTYWGKNSLEFNTDILTWLLAKPATEVATTLQTTNIGE